MSGSPAVSLYTNQTVSDPAALSVAILSSVVAAGQTLGPLMVTSQPLPNLASVPVSLNPTTSQKPLQSSIPTAQETLLEAAGQAAEGPPASAAKENKAVDSSAVDSQPQVRLCAFNFRKCCVTAEPLF